MLSTPLSTPPTPPRPAVELAAMLTDARTRSLALMQDTLEARELGPRLAIVNPPLWELGHLGYFHDHFALRGLFGLPDYQIAEAERLFDSSSIAHDDRWSLPLPSREQTLAYLSRVQQAMLERLPDGEASSAQSYVYQLTTLHEDMHGEAFLYTRQTLGDPAPDLGTPPPGFATGEPAAGAQPGDVAIPGGRHLLGSDESVPFRFDNEKAPMEVHVAPFSIAKAPVANAEFAAFVDDGGYTRRQLWSEAGWRWCEKQGLQAPVYWRQNANGRWEERRFDRWGPLPPHQPVVHVNWFEAEAWCRWAGRRLPSEAEWEVAASREPTPDGASLAPGKRRFPWGDTPPVARLANLDGWRLAPLDVAALPDGDSAFGCRQMLGNVWEWTASPFGPFPGFEPELYRDYSAPWFKEGRYVLRGGAWATRGRLIHNGYRNFFTPERQDILAGFRTCAL
ncbi:SUMF1/EgtB/PvdO family nonheme iron enzyme [Halomonas sp. ANAO-440]|uniref:selenoneine synthase SenA n=1 Tax=Halomonas sp. ANAO-440 TaxID=2861360 RepID=UPI001CAA4E32|nr:selenoneine synthase SenA [Halomonas sp. ANAO-440]MBZ0329604.1 SUMF1/EgtB/PvdO family nonheme iron enzyme [Halomonas sp. ANAO-440]